MKVSVILCTKNPKPLYIQATVRAILNQNYTRQFEFIVVDNYSAKNVRDHFLNIRKIKWVLEKKPGLTSARLRGLQESKGELLVFVDDDNILSKDYIRSAVKMAIQDPKTGVWSAEITGNFEVKPPAWAKKYMPFLALITHSKEKISSCPDGGTLPIGAGMVVRRSIMNTYAKEVKCCPIRSVLDRRPGTLMAGGDTDIGYTAIRLGYGCRYTKKLRLTHLIPKERLEPNYLFQLAKDITASHQILKRIHLKQSESYLDRAKALIAKIACIIISPKSKRGLQIATLLGKREGNKKVDLISKVTRDNPTKTA